MRSMSFSSVLPSLRGPSLRGSVVVATFGAMILASTGCQQRSTFRLSEIEVTSSGGTVTKSEVTYNDDGTVDEIERTVGGAFDQRFEAKYDRGVFDKITVIDDNNDPYDFEFTWDGPLLTRTESDRSSYVARYTYRNETPGSLDSIERSYRFLDTTTLSERIEFDRDSDGNIIGTTDKSTFSIPIFGDTITTVVNEYDWDEGVLAGVTRSTTSGDNTDVDSFDFDYEDKGLFVGNVVTGADIGNNSYEVEYDDQGRIIEVVQDNGGDTTTTRYTYEDGTSNLVWTPAIPYEQVFDLKGKPYNTVELLNSSILLGTL